MNLALEILLITYLGEIYKVLMSVSYLIIESLTKKYILLQKNLNFVR